jgi:hypothetical protein
VICWRSTKSWRVRSMSTVTPWFTGRGAALE